MRALSRLVPLAILLGATAMGACGGGDDTPRAASGSGGSGGAPPPWLGDAGLVTRPPVQRPLRDLCGLSSNPGDMPIGDDPASQALRAGYFAAAKDLGVHLIRHDFRFALIEPEKGTFDFARYDALVAEAKANGVEILALLAYGTTWAHPGAPDEFYPPDDPQDFADFAAAVASRYAGELAGYEIWNEPNGGYRFWRGTDISGDPVAYAALLEAASSAIRAVDPKTPVLLGGTVFTPQVIEGAIPWLERAYDAQPDLASAFDVAGIHTYGLYPPRVAPEVSTNDDDPPLEAKIQMHAWLLAQHGADDTPIAITEIGWPVAGDVDEAAQARYLVRATILAARAGASQIDWYTLRDGKDFAPDHFPPEDAFGLLHYDADPAAKNPPSPKKSYVALRALLATVGDRWPSAEKPVPGASDDVIAVRFEGAGGLSPVLAAWTISGAAAQIEAPFAGELVAEDGTSRGPIAAGAPVALDGDVVYVR